MNEFTLRILNGLKWWTGFFSVLFLIVLLTAPSLFGVHFISGTAVASCLLYATIGFFIGYGRAKSRKQRLHWL